MLSALGLRRQILAAPALTIDPVSLRPGSQQVLDPQAIGFVNSGSAPAFNVRYEIRRYYDSLLWRNYACRSREIIPAIAPGKGFQVEWTPGHDDPEVARFFTWEVRVHYEQQDGASFLSFASVGMVGQLTRHSHAAGWVRRRVLPLETWSRHFFPSLLLN